MPIMHGALAPTEKAKQDALKLREAIQAVRDEIKKLPAVKQFGLNQEWFI